MHWIAATALCAVAVSLPIFAVYNHVNQLRQPDVQMILCKIIIVVPLLSAKHYSVIMGFLRPDIQALFQLITEWYACYALYLFVTPLFFHFVGGHAVALVHMDAVELTDCLHRRGRQLLASLRHGIFIAGFIKAMVALAQFCLPQVIVANLAVYSLAALFGALLYGGYCLNLLHLCLRSRLISLGEVRSKTWLVILLTFYMPVLEGSLQAVPEYRSLAPDVCLGHMVLFGFLVAAKFSSLPFKGRRSEDAKPLLEQGGDVTMLEELNQESADSDEEFGFLYNNG
eukprot:GEMP01044237.1.p1 GENE.GEMP01044237.1~~GEMP01044237.1.p1  ORF type:complete len:284 (+),score=45.20 GEMP01044237.1:292-1143(+)